jgi:mRNA interferase MazF
LNRGDVVEVDWPGAGRHPAVIVTRQVAIPSLNALTVALVTSRVRGIRTEVLVGAGDGLVHDSVVNCDNLATVPKQRLGRRLGHLQPGTLHRLNQAIIVALELDQVI